MRLSEIGRRDALAAVAAIGVGAFAIAEAAGYPFGEPRRMGPGFFPMVLGVLLVGLGAGIALEALGRRAVSGDEAVNPRGVIAVSAAILAFGLLIESAGLVPAIFAAVVVGSFGEPTARPLASLLLAAGLSAFSVAVFISGLSLPIRAVAW